MKNVAARPEAPLARLQRMTPMPISIQRERLFGQVAEDGAPSM